MAPTSPTQRVAGKRRQYSLKFVLLIAIFSFFLGCYLNNLVHLTNDASSGHATLSHDHRYDAPLVLQRLQHLLGENNSNLTNKERRKDNNKAPETTKAKADPPQPRISKTSESTPPKVQAQEVGASQQPKKKNAPKEKPTDDNDNSTPPRDKKEIPMNIVLLYADDWTYKTLGKVNPFVKTPNLDKLADKGILFTHNCVTTSVCWMSRATLFTGQYASTHHAFKPSKGPFFETWNETLWQQLANAGYYNGFFGKWHNGMARRDLINQAMHENKFYFGRHWQTKSKHVTVKNYEDGVDFLLKKKWGDRPFSLTVSFYATHAMDTSKEHYYPQPKSMSLYANDTVPVNGNHTESWKRMPYFFGEKNEGRKRFRDRYKTAALYQTKMKNMYRMATEVDTACGKIIEELERQDLLKNTMIIFTTDNGNFHSEHGLADKWFPHEESIRVPLIVWDPRMPSSKAGTTNDEFTLNLDLAPTILSAAGLTPPASMQGEDFSKLYLQEHTTKWRDEFFYEFPSTFPSSYLPIAEALVRKDYKYLFWSQFDYHQLFHVSEDPTEQVDLVNEPSLAGMLLAMKVRFNELKAKVTKEVEVMVVATVQPKEGVHVTQQLAVKPEQEVKQD